MKEPIAGLHIEPTKVLSEKRKDGSVLRFFLYGEVDDARLVREHAELKRRAEMLE